MEIPSAVDKAIEFATTLSVDLTPAEISTLIYKQLLILGIPQDNIEHHDDGDMWPYDVTFWPNGTENQALGDEGVVVYEDSEFRKDPTKPINLQVDYGQSW